MNTISPAARTGWTAPVVLVLGFVLTLGLVAGGVGAVGGLARGTVGVVAIVTAALAISVPFLAREGVRRGDRRLPWLLIGALVLKIVAAFGMHYVAFKVYGGVADARAYNASAVRVAERFSAGDFSIPDRLKPVDGTSFIELLTGGIYAVIGPNMVAAFLIYALMSYLGLFFFYRAFSIAVPRGSPFFYAALIFFLPSLVFWPSTIGKDAWMVMSLGVAVYGAARALTGRLGRGLMLACLGLAMAAVVRPHVAGMIAVALTVACMLKAMQGGRGHRGRVVVVALFGLLAAIGGLRFTTARFATAGVIAKGSQLYTFQGASAAISEVSRRTSDGRSQFKAPSILESPANTPLAVVTVLFRPLLNEAHNVQAQMAALEGTFLMLFTLMFIRRLGRALRTARRHPYVALALVYVAVFIVGFSSFSNFGLLARERVQLFPFYLVPFAISLKEKPGDLDHAAA
jgi:hypothetical protein